jgi:hypothetical protein
LSFSSRRSVSATIAAFCIWLSQTLSGRVKIAVMEPPRRRAVAQETLGEGRVLGEIALTPNDKGADRKGGCASRSLAS